MKRILKICILIVVMILFSSLTTGPSQPEVNSFTPIGASDLVNVTTGDFSYNIPLMDVGGYPLSISYNSGVTMDQEASMVGLGWNLDVGAITRTVRGLPDDFKGDTILKKVSIEPNITHAFDFGVGAEFLGVDEITKVIDNPLGFIGPANAKTTKKKNNKDVQVGASLGFYINNYTGKGTTFGFSGSVPVSKNFNLGGGLGGNSKQLGLDVTPSLSLDSEFKENEKNHFSFGLSNISLSSTFNSTTGVKAFNLGAKYGLNTDKDKVNFKYNESTNLHMVSSFSYTPKIEIPMKTVSFSQMIKLGGEVLYLHPNGSIKETITIQSIVNDTIERASYGYLYSQNSKNEDDITDVNRERDAVFKEETPNLAVPNFTKDIFMVSGHGIGGMFQPFRNDVGVLHDPAKSSKNLTNNIGFDAGLGAGTHLGGNWQGVYVNSSTERWTKNNFADDSLGFQKSVNLYEAVYFKKSGEINFGNSNISENFNDFSAVAFKVHNTIISANTKPTLKNELSNKSIISTIQKNQERTNRNQLFSFLTAKRSSVAGIALDNKLNYFSSDYLINNKSPLLIKDRVSDEKKEHHISEITVLKEDGNRYIYGLPIYNNVETEVVFNVSKNITYPSLGLVDYDATDASTDNQKGCSKFYSSTKKPPFAHSFMLTALLSSDYQDKTGDGVSDDDIGTAIKFNYLMADDSYKWRAPYLKDKANFQEGLNSSTNDNQGNYIYGEKELVYIQSIQSKTHTAIFEYGERLDGVEVKGSQGGEGKSSMNKLISITLYTNPELEKNNPTYVMKVHFVYDNSLCKGISNNRNKRFENTVKHDLKNSGKLTLQEVYFTYNGSSKSARNRYKFDYQENNPDFNPDYHLKANNRWGTYKPENANPNNLTNAEYPYVLQDKTNEDVYVSAWSLRQIDLPSGASMNIDYESDSYEYVQDRKAMQMFTIKGFSTEANTPLNSLSDQLYTGNGKQNNEEVNEYMYLEYSGINPDILKRIVKDIKSKHKGYVSFNCMINIDNKKHYESVRGYGKIVNYGMNTSSQNSFWIKFEETETGCAKEVKTHPISLTAINFGKLYMMSIFTNTDCPPKVNTELTTKEKKALINETKNDKKNYLFRCFNNWLVENEGCKSVKLDESFVRLFSPTEKLGGGSRVKKITIHDSWDKMTEGSESVYGKEYTYHKGVASYEPLFGGDENPFKQPVTYSVDNKFLGIKMAPSVDYMQEEPIGEIHFPSAQVVYTRVTEKNLRKKDIKRNATGKTVYTHYTSKDFPTICQKTTLNPVVRKNILSGIGPYQYNNVAASQGFVVIKNDMHGKLKKKEEFRVGQNAPYSWISYNYKTIDTLIQIPLAGEVLFAGLNNKVKAIDDNGNITEKLLGIDYDIYTDMRRFTDNVDAPRFSLNYDVPVVIPPLLPIPVISPIPGYTRTETSFSSAVIQKVIHQYGILESVVVSDENSSISTKNILYDAETGNVLLTKTYNEYEDPIINFSYPAHWAYKLMGSAYENLLYSTIIESDGNGKITSNSDYLFNGDELLLEANSGSFGTTSIDGVVGIPIKEIKAWVLEKDNGGKYLINRMGNIIEAKLIYEVDATVIRSGNRNQINTSMAQITSSNLKNNDIQNNLKDVYILNASAVEFNDYWRIPELVNIESDSLCKKDTINPFVEGILGNYRPTKNYLFLSDRQKSATDVNVRKDGYYKDFSPFWGLFNQEWFKSSNKNWKWSAEVTEYDVFGNAIEERDPLDRYSANQLGYNNTLVVASAINSKLQNFGVENFEDHNYFTKEKDCEEPHFSFVNSGANLSSVSHTGTKSVGVNSNSNIKLTKTISSSQGQILQVPYKLTTSDYISGYNPDNTTSVLSAWVKVASRDAKFSFSDDAKITVANKTLKPSGPIIDGWQKISGEFTIPNSGNVNIMLHNISNNKVYFDDLRIEPINASVKSYVYHPVSLRLMAVLDENNYATFYEYDLEGNLIRVKKETERGIKTIKETNQHLRSGL